MVEQLHGLMYAQAANKVTFATRAVAEKTQGKDEMRRNKKTSAVTVIINRGCGG
jgi:hypothetical protein